MSEWFLVPNEQHEAQYDAISDTGISWRDNNSADIYKMHIEARPAIPRAVWDAMVERGARAHKEAVLGHGVPIWDDDRAYADIALRAALGNPVVEGDGP